MSTKNNSQRILDFIIEAEKLKTVLRCSYTSNNIRKESSAEHSWLMAIMAMGLFNELGVVVDQLKVMKMIAVHDIAEVYVDDIPAYEVSERNKK